MYKYSVFYELSSQNVHNILSSLGSEEKNFKKGDFILKFNVNFLDVGILRSGLAYLISVDDNGDKNIFDFYSSGDIFGQPFSPDSNVNLCYIIAKKDCCVNFFPYKNLFNLSCQDSYTNTQFLKNVFSSFKRNHMHIDILSQRTIRNKLLICFRYFSDIYDSKTFDLPVPLFDLADFICVDRSAMMREIRKMNNDGIIHSKGKNITLL